jgi:hypothetical protein
LKSYSGGGSKNNAELDSGNISLSWIRLEAQLAGLLASTPDLRFRMVDLGGLPRNQLKGGWKLIQLFYLRRPKREVRPDQKIHASVLFKRLEYTPVASIPQEFSYQSHRTLLHPWDEEHSPGKAAQLDDRWEKGIFGHDIAKIIMDEFFHGRKLEFVHYIAFLARSRESTSSHDVFWLVFIAHKPKVPNRSRPWQMQKKFSKAFLLDN